MFDILHLIVYTY